MSNDNKQSDFFLKEYEVIANSHFNISQRITTFFQYLLAIYAAPLLLTNAPNLEKFLPYVSILIGLVAFCASLYLYQLRNEAILYARVVNSMRSYHYNIPGLSTENTMYYQVLPTQKSKPAYVEHLQFLWIVLATGIANSSYFVFGLYYFGTLMNSPKWFYIVLWIIIIIGHYLIYRVICYFAEKGSDMYSETIGIDIDGVLNEHTFHFCKIANKIYPQIEINHDEIIKIPVRKCISHIDRKKEESIFLTQEYWTEMPIKIESTYYVNKIKKNLRKRVHIFTNRDWTDADFNLDRITKKWLKCKGFIYNRIFIEKKTKKNNRYTLSKKRKIKYFVEDNLDNAMKLSTICRVVFLMDQLYNQSDNLPKNIVRVSNWEEIYDWLGKYD